MISSVKFSSESPTVPLRENSGTPLATDRCFGRLHQTALVMVAISEDYLPKRDKEHGTANLTSAMYI